MRVAVSAADHMTSAAYDIEPDDPADPRGWRKERRDLLAGVAGGALVGMPLLFTMEMWFRGATMSAWHQLVVLAATLAINFAFCFVSGFRPKRGVWESALEAVTAVGIGLAFAAAVLVLIGEINPGVSFAELSGKLLLEAAAVSLGVSFADAHLRGKSRTGSDTGNGGNGNGNGSRAELAMDADALQLREDLLDVAATLIGSVLFALNVAPTEEVILIASRLNAWQLLALLGGTIALCYVILYASGFEDQPVHVKGLLQSPWAETVTAVGTSLLVSLALLWLVGRTEATSSIGAAVASTVALGLPATVGGAAGRLVT
jgi:putative integral membrane protein (TIGR02587 family)